MTSAGGTVTTARHTSTVRVAAALVPAAAVSVILLHGLSEHTLTIAAHGHVFLRTLLGVTGR